MTTKNSIEVHVDNSFSPQSKRHSKKHSTSSRKVSNLSNCPAWISHSQEKLDPETVIGRLASSLRIDPQVLENQIITNVLDEEQSSQKVPQYFRKEKVTLANRSTLSGSRDNAENKESGSWTERMSQQLIFKMPTGQDNVPTVVKYVRAFMLV